QVFAAMFENDVHQVVLFRRGLGNEDVAFLVEHPRNGPRFGHVAAVFAKDVTNFAHRAVTIVGVDVEQNRDAARPIAFEREFFVGGAGQFAPPALDGPLDVVGGHILGLGGKDGAAQAWVGIRIAAAVLRGNADFLDETGENLAAL